MAASITNEPESSRACSDVVAVARGILSGGVGIVAGARQLSRLRFDMRAETDADFLYFVGVDSETDHLLVGDVRRHWSADALLEKDVELQDYEAWARERAFEVCRSLLQRYDNPA
jgi:hypothetical protein